MTAAQEVQLDELWKVQKRVERLHELGFDVAEMDVVADEEGERLRMTPRVVESGYHEERLSALTGLVAEENQARRLLNDIRAFGTELTERHGKTLPENIVAVRWLDRRFEPTIAAIPPELIGKLQAAEIYHQVLEHRWFASEREDRDVPLEEAVESYIADILSGAPDEQVRLDHTIELPMWSSDFEPKGSPSARARSRRGMEAAKPVPPPTPKSSLPSWRSGLPGVHRPLPTTGRRLELKGLPHRLETQRASADRPR